MIRVTVDLVPFGEEQHSKKIGELVLANFGVATEYDKTMHQYKAVYKDDHTGTHATKTLHYRNEGVWKLLIKLLANGDFDMSADPDFKRLEERLK